MQINVHYHLDIEGTKLLGFGRPVVNLAKFKENPHKEAARAAYKRFEEIRREHGYRDTKIDKIIYNGQHDITDRIRKVYEAPLDLKVKWKLKGLI